MTDWGDTPIEFQTKTAIVASMEEYWFRLVEKEDECSTKNHT